MGWRWGGASFAQPTALLLRKNHTVGESQERQERTGGILPLLSQLWRQLRTHIGNSGMGAAGKKNASQLPLCSHIKGFKDQQKCPTHCSSNSGYPNLNQLMSSFRPVFCGLDTKFTCGFLVREAKQQSLCSTLVNISQWQ